MAVPTVVQLFGHDSSEVSESTLEDVFGGLFEGPFEGVDSECKVIADSPASMNTETGTGTFCVGGIFGKISVAGDLLHDASHATLNRIDRIILKRDNTADLATVEILKGSDASPGSEVAPSLTRTATVHEVSLAQVLIAAAVTQINAADITDERSDYSVCGYALGKATVQVERDDWLWVPARDFHAVQGMSATDYVLALGSWAQGAVGWNMADGATLRGIIGHTLVPKRWKSGTITATAFYQGGGAGNFRIGMGLAAITPGTDQMQDTNDATEDATVSSPNNLVITAFSTIALAVAAGDLINMYFQRNGAHADDTSVNNLVFFGVRLVFTAEY